MFAGCIELPDSKETKLGSSNQEACVPAAISSGVDIFPKSLGVICYDR